MGKYYALSIDVSTVYETKNLHNEDVCVSSRLSIIEKKHNYYTEK